MFGNRWRRTRCAPPLLLGLVLASLVGCVERRYTIRTDPPGALVIVNGEEMPPSPVSVSHTFYGDREIILIADNYQTQRIIQPMPAPWYQWPLIDFVAENLVPFTIRDERVYEYKMVPATSPQPADLLNRAESLRNQGKVPPKPRRGGFFGFFGF